MFTRRLFAQLTAAAPVLALTPAEAAESRLDHYATLDRYIAFLAHEHRAALFERFDCVYTIIRNADGPSEPQEMRIEPPMFWMPDYAPDLEAIVSGAPASSRAVRVLRAI